MLFSTIAITMFTIGSVASPFTNRAILPDQDPQVVEVIDISEVDYYENGKIISSSLVTQTEEKTVHPPSSSTKSIQPADTGIPNDALTVEYVDPRKDEDTFAAISVWHHNVHRKNHTAPPLVWNHALFLAAQWKADNCTFNEEGIPWIDNVGMNIAGGTYGSKHIVPNPSSMVSGLWYNSEIGNFPAYGVDDLDASSAAFESWGHFSQVVWPSSVELGCGLSDCGDTWFGVCLYSPPGNFIGHFSKVGRPLGFPAVYPNGNTHM